MKDSGRGLARKKSTQGGLGLDIMRYRAAMIGATLEIETVRNRGTTVYCQLSRSTTRKTQPHEPHPANRK